MAFESMADEEKKSKTISFRVLKSVYSDFENQCDAANMSKSELFRDYIAKSKIQVIARPSVSRDTKRAVFLIQKASNNINQLAHRANSEFRSGMLSEQTFIAINNQLEQVSKMLQDGRHVN